ncbi:MAG: 4-(cytidine 5'-diphospho)-2-C-methyl-D-erythritol kinase [Sedimentisphaerales bacterium]|nr:4-(cytidine 5'-diphospho)-2-C-methyl-D-erythritol kinase [Sedimentisphaerales bacterium]
MTSTVQFETIGDGLLVRAPAKINLSLLIAGKRPDGFHELETVMAKINWFDEVLIEPGSKPGIELTCQGPEWAPAGDENLVYRAARLLLDNAGRKADVSITLTKNIPAGTGLGSASSDAAATLLGLNRYLELGAPADDLHGLAARLGSDVPFFLGGPLAFCTGKGEKIKKIDKNFDFLAMLILPNVSVSTITAYDNYTHDQALYETLHSCIKEHLEKHRIDLIAQMCANMLAGACFGLQGEIAKLKAAVESTGITPCCLSGSGSAMFYIIGDADERAAYEYQTRIRKEFGCRSIIVTNNRW